MKKGITLTELIVTMGLLALLLVFSGINFISSEVKANLDTQLMLMISDIRNQQFKAMMGDELATIPSSQGIHFNANSYILFKGGSFDQNDPANRVVNLNPELGFTGISLPGSNLVFSPGSGECSGCQAGTDTFELINIPTGKNFRVTINHYGTITNID
jgi:type II secretory pathway pseudopilin PulG